MSDKLLPSTAPRPAAELGRYGAMLRMSLTIAACGLWIPGAHALDISVRPLPQNTYELTLTHGATLDERAARGYIAEAAVTVCKGLTPVMGKYRFASQEALGTGLLSRKAPTYRFVQEVSCEAKAQSAPSQRAPILTSPEETKRAREEVSKSTEAYFRLLSAQRFEEAYSQMRETALATDKASWVREKQSLQSLAGDPISISIVKITVYDNPAEAPEPGLYAAADFQNAYRNVPYECGYLMWYRLQDGTYAVTRSEIGRITTNDLKRIPEGQRPELLRKLRCVAP